MASRNSPNSPIYISIDRGGTFTDVYARCGDRIYTEKLLSSDPAHYADASSEGIRRIIERITKKKIAPGSIPTDAVGWIRMGTTVATNALLERKGTDCALAITRGFENLPRIGYQNRPELFALNIVKPEQIYCRVIEIDERVRPVGTGDKGKYPILTGIDGEQFALLRKPDPADIRVQLQEIYDAGIRGLAVVFMHGFTCTNHEKLVGSIARELGFKQISLSHEVMPRIRIVGRGDTTCVDAYLTPHINAYLDDFKSGFNDASGSTPLYFMQSDGGLTEADNFRGSNAILSGPAGGVVGYATTTRARMGSTPVIGFDMGGTSTDISRFDRDYELVHETETGGVRIQAPQLAISTVAAGGGSRLFYRNSVFTVGPESSGAHPGPVCYRKGGYLSITDANLLLGRLDPDYFPHIFGPNEDLPLDIQEVREEFKRLTDEINTDLAASDSPALTPDQVALGFIEVANEVMVRPIREISIMRGFNIKEHILACFGGAGGQHGVAIARRLDIKTIFIHRDAGILSALGIGSADVVIDRQEPAGAIALSSSLHKVKVLDRLDALASDTMQALTAKGHGAESITVIQYLNLRYDGTDTQFMVARPEDDDFGHVFSQIHTREFGFDLHDRPLLVDDIRIRATASLPSQLFMQKITAAPGRRSSMTRCCFRQGWMDTPVFELTNLGRGQHIKGPALIIASTSTLLVEPDSRAEITDYGDIIVHLEKTSSVQISTKSDPIHLAVFSSRFMSIAEQMGRVLQKTALSTNIKERLDFSCAIFDPEGGLVANAPHVPVHLGAMGEAVKKQILIQGKMLKPGDVLLSNHPAAGGSHLPDITVITPVWDKNTILFFVASRGHHSDVGGISPGSMPPFSTTLDEEGVHIESFKIIENGRFKEQKLRNLMQQNPSHPVRNPDTVIADIKAQTAANQRGIDLLSALIHEHSEETVIAYMRHIQANAEEAVRAMLRSIAANRHDADAEEILEAEDFLDDTSPIHLRISIDRHTGDACFDFTGTGPELQGNLNAPPAVTQSAILYALRCLIDLDIPLNQGCMNPITVVLPPGSLLNPSASAAVVGGNVLTSQRIVDVIFKAFKAAAASQGCMNNLTFGDNSFGYYETIGGGSGAGPNWHGCSGVHTHMTNTRITDPEILEQRYPVILREFSIRHHSGGTGRYNGGDGLIREIEFRHPLNVTILSERRVFAPYGLHGGNPGACGKNLLLRADGRIIDLGGKNEVQAMTGDRIRILTPGGGGWGKKLKVESGKFVKLV